ncbi:MAG: NAD-dependent epimerase [Chloroflexota bacterium]|nr:MAG: NAD-dependent epimerase [Chloroflexota bacterium]
MIFTPSPLLLLTPLLMAMIQRVLVTGGAGFLGSHIADVLTARGYGVTVFDVRPSPYLQARQRMVVADMRDGTAVAEAVAGQDAIFHLAALADLNAAKSQPITTAELNIMGTLNFLEAARANGVSRFVFASTVYVYSRAGGFYRCSKQACEAFIEEYQQQFGLEYTILRYGSLYGPRADASNGVYRLLRQAAVTGQIEHVGTPEDSREYIHVEDAARLSVDALAEEFANQHVVLTGHHPIRLRDLFTMFGEMLGRPLHIQYQPATGPENSHYQMTPYAFHPRVGRKLTTNYYVDMGQGLLQMLEQLFEEGHISVMRDA